MAYDVQKGYEIKTDQINDAVSDSIPIYFFNVFEDDPKLIIIQLKKERKKEIGDFRSKSML